MQIPVERAQVILGGDVNRASLGVRADYNKCNIRLHKLHDSSGYDTSADVGQGWIGFIDGVNI